MLYIGAECSDLLPKLPQDNSRSNRSCKRFPIQEYGAFAGRTLPLSFLWLVAALTLWVSSFKLQFHSDLILSHEGLSNRSDKLAVCRGLAMFNELLKTFGPTLGHSSFYC